MINLRKSTLINDWEDICEGVLGINFNEGKELTNYPLNNYLVKNSSSSYKTMFKIQHEECNRRVLPENKLTTYGEFISCVYVLLMRDYVNLPFTKKTFSSYYEAFQKIINNFKQAKIEKNGQEQGEALEALSKLFKERITKPFAAESNSEKNESSDIDLTYYFQIDGYPLGEMQVETHCNRSLKEEIDGFFYVFLNSKLDSAEALREWYKGELDEDSNVDTSRGYTKFFKKSETRAHIRFDVVDKNKKVIDKQTKISECLDKCVFRRKKLVFLVNVTYIPS